MRRRNQCIGLCLAFTVSIFLCGVLISLLSVPGSDGSMLAEGMWIAWTFMADPGTHADVGLPGIFDLAEDGGIDLPHGSNKSSSSSGAPELLWPQRIVAFLTAWLGIVFFSILLGMVVDFIRAKMDQLKKGRSTVIENGHTLLLGWTDKSCGVIKEIALANESVKGGVVVVLAPEAKERIEADIREQLSPNDLNVNGSRTKVVVRQGSPLYVADLNKVSAHLARAIILLAETGASADSADAQSLRVILTLRGMKQGLLGHVTCEIRDVDNEGLLELVGGEILETVVSHDIMGRLMLMSARQPGLAKVYNTTLGFDGDEFYTEVWPELDGIAFGDLLPRLPDAICIGVRTVSGNVLLNPPRGRLMGKGEGLIVIAEDDDTYQPKPAERIDMGDPPLPSSEAQRTEKILFSGWRRDIRDMFMLLDDLVNPGTEVHIICEVPAANREPLLRAQGLDVDALQNIELVHHVGNTGLRRHLEPLPMGEYTCVLIVADESREIDMMHSDSQALAALLLIRDLQQEAHKHLTARLSAAASSRVNEWQPEDGDSSCACVCEILDSRTQRTIASSEAVALKGDFIESNTLISRILAMVAEDRSVRVILDELLGAAGAAFSVKSSSRVCRRGEKLNFFQVARRTQEHGQILCGYQLHNSIEDTVMNPRDKYRCMVWDDFDLVVMEGQSQRETKIHRSMSNTDVKRISQRLTTFGRMNSNGSNEPSSPLPRGPLLSPPRRLDSGASGTTSREREPGREESKDDMQGRRRITFRNGEAVETHVGASDSLYRQIQPLLGSLGPSHLVKLAQDCLSLHATAAKETSPVEPFQGS